MKDIVDDKIRDSIMNNIKVKRGNQTCFDCNSRSPTWSSPYLGILLCIECAGRHRSYGTHISFVKSIDLDKWNKKQLKSLELTGNSYAKRKFNELNIPIKNSIYDYNNDLILKYRKDVEKLVEENFKEDDYTNLDDIKKCVYETKNEDNENNLLNPVKFEIEKKSVKVDKNKNTRNKIKKIDIDFDFENFTNETSNDSKNNNENQEINTNKIKGMKLSRKDKKLQMIEEKKNKNNKNNKSNKSCCVRFKEFLLSILGLNTKVNKNDVKTEEKNKNK